MRPKLLIIDTDKATCCSIVSLLKGYTYDCTCAHSGVEAIRLLEKTMFHLIIMDHQLPDMGGFYLLRQILLLQQTQVIILSADDSEYNRIRAFDDGATDFVSKPIMYHREFVCRVRAILRRCLKHQIILSRIHINLSDQTVRCDGENITLTSQLFQFLVILASKPGQVVERHEFLSSLDGPRCSASDNLLYVLAYRLRLKLEQNPNKPQLIHTVRGVGYLLTDG